MLPFMEGVSYLSMGAPMVVYGLLALFGFLWLRRKAESQAVILALILFTLGPLMKLLVDRPRPPAEALVRVTHDYGGLGFPSGHAFQAALMFGVLCFLATVTVRETRMRRVIQATMVFLIGAIGMSRIYLGAHWPSDVLGGYLAATPLLALVVYFYHRAKAKSTPRPATASYSPTLLRNYLKILDP